MKTRQHLGAAAIAAALGLAVMTGSGWTLAKWEKLSSAGTSTITAGKLSYTQTSVKYLLTRTDFTAGATAVTQLSTTTTDVTSSIGTLKLIPGDKVSIATDVTVTAVGNNLAAELVVTPSSITSGDSALNTELAVAGNQVATVTGISTGAPALSLTTTNKWRVTPANNGHTYRVALEVKTRPTRDGLARTATVGTQWWQAVLQGTSTSTSSTGIQLNQLAT